MAITPLFPTDSGPQPGSMGVVRGGTVAGRTVGGACVVAIPSVEHLPALAANAGFLQLVAPGVLAAGIAAAGHRHVSSQIGLQRLRGVR